MADGPLPPEDPAEGLSLPGSFLPPPTRHTEDPDSTFGADPGPARGASREPEEDAELRTHPAGDMPAGLSEERQPPG